MANRYLVFFILLTGTLSALPAQVLTLRVNGDSVAHNSTYGYQPFSISVGVTHASKSYQLEKGTITLVKNKKIAQTVDFTGVIPGATIFSAHNLAGARINIHIETIRDPDTKKLHQIRKLIGFNLSDPLPLKPEVDAELSVLLNGSTDYVKKGIDIPSVKKVEVIIADRHKSSPVTVYLARGRMAVGEYVYKDYLEFEKSFPEQLQTMGSRSGDRIVIQFNKAAKMINIPVN